MRVARLSNLRGSGPPGYDALVQPLNTSQWLMSTANIILLRQFLSAGSAASRSIVCSDGSDWIKSYPNTLLTRYIETGETLHLYAFLGAVAGIVDSSLLNSEQDWREPNEALQRLQRYFPAKS